MAKSVPTADWIRSILDFDTKTGTFRWKHRDSAPKSWNTKYAGKIAGHQGARGYIYVQIGGVNYAAHQLAWLWVHGEWVTHLDHRYGIRSDNRILELRPAGPVANACNKAIQSNNTSGHAGVHYDKHRRKWRSCADRSGVRHIFGFFDTKEEAINARAKGIAKVHGDFVASPAKRPRYRRYDRHARP